MPVLHRIAYFQDRRDEVPNQELARDLAKRKDRKGIAELAQNLANKNATIQSDCLKVLYEVGALDPSLIAGHANEFVKLLGSKNNRLVWGSLIALATVAELEHDVIAKHFDEIVAVMADGSVITRDNGVKTLARAASRNSRNRSKMFDYLIQHLASCRSKDVAQHCEHTLAAVTAGNKREFLAVLNRRLGELSAAQATRVKRVMRVAEGR